MEHLLIRKLFLTLINDDIKILHLRKYIKLRLLRN